MLKTLSTTPDEAGSDTEAETDNTERRMRRALEALSGPGLTPEAPAVDNRGAPAFRQDRGFDRGHAQGQRRDMRDNPVTHNAKARHRFVKDGEVPVVHLGPPRARDASVPVVARPEPDAVRFKEIIEDQRARLEQAERAGREIQAQMRALQTKCAHTEMALADATALAESRLHEIEALREQVPVPDAPPLLAPPTGSVSELPEKRRRGRPPGRKAAPPATGDHEPEPVQWWLQPLKLTGKTRRRG